MSETTVRFVFGEAPEKVAEPDCDAAKAARKASRDVLASVLRDPHPNLHVHLSHLTGQSSSFGVPARR